ncbi:MAG: MFS transporter [Elusimicrobia bacterium]|nr:MFS transporter [Elusimicrobiota bacterium]
MDKKTRDRALNLSIADGVLSAIMRSLCGGIFLTGFVLKILESDPGKIGILASLPLFANIVQLFGSYIIEKTGKNKMLCFISAGISRALWLFVLILPFKIFSPVSDYRIWFLVAIIGASSIFASLSSVGWLSWMSDLVPAESRGAYFGKRNMFTAFFGMIFVLLGGWFIKFWAEKYTEVNPYGFIILFAVGIIAGLSSLIFMFAIPEVETEEKEVNEEFSPQLFLMPLKDKNFCRLVIFASIWIFAVNIAGPYYAVYMINMLNIDFSALALFGTASTIATLIMMKIWGPITDKLGNKPVIIVSGVILIFVPFIWLVARAEAYNIPVVVAHILSGAFMAGATLSQFNILIKMSPQEGRSVYLALYAVMTGLIGALAPLAGGVLFGWIKNFSIAFFVFNINAYHLIFLFSSLLIAFSLIFAVRIYEEDSASPVSVVIQLKNDLNPQTGISGAMDFLIVRKEKSEKILRRLDRTSEELATKSEELVKKVLDGAEEITKKPLEKIKEFLKDDDE